MHPSEVTSSNIIMCILFFIYIIIATVNVFEFIIKKELRDPILNDNISIRTYFHVFQYICALIGTVLSFIIPIMYIATIFGYNTPIIDCITNAGG